MTQLTTAEEVMNMYIGAAAMKLIFNFQAFTVLMFRIPDQHRQLAALRGYLRFLESGKNMDDVWAWDDERIKAYTGSKAQTIAKGYIDKARSKFDALPGPSSNNYKLTARAKPRSLDEQVKLYNQNGSAKSAGKKIFEQVGRRMNDFPMPPDVLHVEKFCYMVAQDVHGLPKITNATPGLSDHGHMNAIDFHVKKDGVKVLQSGGADGWRASGMSDALKDATNSVNNDAGEIIFDGPLKSPDEPWHYQYRGPSE